MSTRNIKQYNNNINNSGIKRSIPNKPNNNDKKEEERIQAADHAQALQQIKAARSSVARTRSLIERAQGVGRSGGWRSGDDSGSRRGSGLRGFQTDRKGLQQNGLKARVANGPVPNKQIGKMVAGLRSVGPSTDYTPAGISNRFSANTPMPTMDFTEKAVNHEKYGTGASIVGSEFLFSLRAGDVLPRGSILEAIPFNPRFWGGTRLQVASALWGRYLVRNMVLEYVPIVNATVDGAIQMWPDYDPDSYPVYDVGDSAIRRGLAYQNSVQGQVFSYIRSVFHNSDMTEAYFLEVQEGDVRLENQGIWYMQAASDLGSATDVQVYGNIIVHYEVDFYLRALVDPGPELSDVDVTLRIWSPLWGRNSTPVYTDMYVSGGAPLIFSGAFTDDATQGMPASNVPATLGDPGTISFLTVTSPNAVAPSNALNFWNVYGKDVTIVAGTSFWGKVIRVLGNFILEGVTAAGGENYERNLYFVFPTLESASAAPDTISLTSYDDSALTTNTVTWGGFDGSWPVSVDTGFAGFPIGYATADTSTFELAVTIMPTLTGSTT